jgi:hypothetical protein
MASFKTNPLFFSSLLVLGALTAGQAWLVFSQRSQLAKANAEIEQQTVKLNNFAAQNPFPDQANLTAIETDLEQARKTNAEIREVLRATSDIAATMAAAQLPSSSTDAYFDIANFVERIRAAAVAAEVKIDEKNRLGFFTYVNEGPPRCSPSASTSSICWVLWLRPIRPRFSVCNASVRSPSSNSV